MLLYECKVLLVSSACFFPTDDRTLVLDCCKGKPEFLLWVIFCVYLLLYASLRLLHLTVAQNLYTVHVLFHIDTGYIYCSIFCYEFNTAFGGCGYFNLPIVRSKRQLILKHTLCTCILVLGLSTLDCGEYLY